MEEQMNGRQIFRGGGGDGDSSTHDDYGEESGPDSPETSTPSGE